MKEKKEMIEKIEKIEEVGDIDKIDMKDKGNVVNNKEVTDHLKIIDNVYEIGKEELIVRIIKKDIMIKIRERDIQYLKVVIVRGT